MRLPLKRPIFITMSIGRFLIVFRKIIMTTIFSNIFHFSFSVALIKKFLAQNLFRLMIFLLMFHHGYWFVDSMVVDGVALLWLFWSEFLLFVFLLEGIAVWAFYFIRRKLFFENEGIRCRSERLRVFIYFFLWLFVIIVFLLDSSKSFIQKIKFLIVVCYCLNGHTCFFVSVFLHMLSVW